MSQCLKAADADHERKREVVAVWRVLRERLNFKGRMTHLTTFRLGVVPDDLL